MLVVSAYDLLNPLSVSVPIHALASSHGHTVGLQAGIKIAQTDATGAALFPSQSRLF